MTPLIRCARLSLAFGLLAPLACGRPTVPAEPNETIDVGVPGRSNQHVSLASRGSVGVITWATTDPSNLSDVYAAVSTDGAGTFSDPVRVNRQPGDARVNGEAPPQAALVPNTAGAFDIVVVWTARRGDTNLLLTARSVDQGHSFGDTTIVPDTAAPGPRGWHTVSAAADGGVDVLWLDHRRTVGPTAPAQQHHAGMPMPAGGQAYDSVAEAQKSDLYYARLGSTTAPRALAAGVCFCCKTALAYAPSGRI